MPGTRWASFFLPFPTRAFCCPPSANNLGYLLASCLRIWPNLCTQFMMMARVVVGSGGSVVEFSLFGLYKVPCTEGLRSIAVYLGDFPRRG